MSKRLSVRKIGNIHSVNEIAVLYCYCIVWTTHSAKAIVLIQYALIQ